MPLTTLYHVHNKRHWPELTFQSYITTAAQSLSLDRRYRYMAFFAITVHVESLLATATKYLLRIKCNPLDTYTLPPKIHHNRMLRNRGPWCSEISCNVKLNVYLAMEIPDCVSFVSG